MLHLLNESLDLNTNYYKLASLVLQSYWDSFLDYKNTFAIPLGFNAGLLNKNKSELINNEKIIFGLFCGQIKSYRLEMKNIFQNVQLILPIVGVQKTNYQLKV